MDNFSKDFQDCFRENNEESAEIRLGNSEDIEEASRMGPMIAIQPSIEWGDNFDNNDHMVDSLKAMTVLSMREDQKEKGKDVVPDGFVINKDIVMTLKRNNLCIRPIFAIW